MTVIHLTNVSDHDQTFEVHGWNDNHDLTVRAHHTAMISSPDHQTKSGAIISKYGAHEGEQAEITFNAFGGTEVYDISVIVGAGEYLTVEQVGAPNTRKGDPTFMQDLNEHYAKASAKTKADIAGSIHRDAAGRVVRIDAPKFNRALEDFFRTFANGKVYIGVGAWGGSQGNQADNDQSKATPGGNKDLLITYSDVHTHPGAHETARALVSSTLLTVDSKTEQGVNGTIQEEDRAKPRELSEEHQTAVQPRGINGVETGHPLATVSKAVGPPQKPINSSKLFNGTGGAIDEKLRAVTESQAPHQGDQDRGGPGVILSNKSNRAETYCFFPNLWNGNGTAGPNFTNPSKSITLRPHSSAFVALPETFKGRVQRGKLIPATWAEFQLSASDQTGAHADVSLEQGCDGAAMVRSTVGDGRENGFTHDIITGAPAAAVAMRSDGVKVLASTMGN